ncbi:MAG: ankyrin repeat domain-containing protein [Acidobacteriota bacterium]|nr:ankyrin repeat domain-containing protein [Acidobacteriota bacterium]
MQIKHLSFDGALADYELQAAHLYEGWKSGDPAAAGIFRAKHPLFLDEKVPWLSKNQTHSEILAANLDPSGARLALARFYDFRDWSAVEAYVHSLADPGVRRFEAAIEATIDGDAPELSALIAEDPALPNARSRRITHFDPPLHRATLLHYLAANGVENYRQRTPANAVEIAGILLRAGADPNAVAHLYGGECTVMSMLASSSHPANAGVQVALIHKLVDFGAAVDAPGAGTGTSPLFTALVFGFTDAAEALVERGAKFETLAAAAGLGRLEVARRLLAASDPEERHRALALAAQTGQTECVRLLLDAGEDPNRFNPKGTHAHSTPLHQAALRGHAAVVRLLVEHGARTDIRDAIYRGTPLGWAEHAGHTAVADYLGSLS